jgi:hypothetical protein
MDARRQPILDFEIYKPLRANADGFPLYDLPNLMRFSSTLIDFCTTYRLKMDSCSEALAADWLNGDFYNC